VPGGRSTTSTSSAPHRTRCSSCSSAEPTCDAREALADRRRAAVPWARAR
jgi:hypothetical protein